MFNLQLKFDKCLNRSSILEEKITRKKHQNASNYKYRDTIQYFGWGTNTHSPQECYKNNK